MMWLAPEDARTLAYPGGKERGGQLAHAVDQPGGPAYCARLGSIQHGAAEF